MANSILVNGTPQVFNNMLVSFNGDSSVELNNYIKSLSWSTGTQAENVKTVNQLAQPITNNQVVNDPSVSISFAPGAWQNFYAMLNDRGGQFTLQLTNYTTGNLSGAQQNVLIQNARINVNGGGVEATSSSNPSSVSFVATYAGYVTGV